MILLRMCNNRSNRIDEICKVEGDDSCAWFECFLRRERNLIVHMPEFLDFLFRNSDQPGNWWRN